MGHVHYVNIVASAREDFHPGISLISLSIEAEYGIFHMKRYLHLSSFSLCSKCVNATLIVCILLSDIKITKRRCRSRGNS